MAGKPKERARTLLLDEVEKRLKAYALAAGATGVGLVGLSQPAHAEIVYTPTNITFGNGEVFIDLNGDGINDFGLAINATSSFTYQAGHYVKRTLAVGGNLGASVIVDNGSAGVLAQGSRIGQGRSFKNVNNPKQKMLVATSFESSSGLRHSSAKGNWKNVQNRFLGLKFRINGEVHYGWARLNVRSGKSTRISVTLLGYAYETIANQAIKAGGTAETANGGLPEAGTLGALARGAAR